MDNILGTTEVYFFNEVFPESRIYHFKKYHWFTAQRRGSLVELALVAVAWENLQYLWFSGRTTLQVLPEISRNICGPPKNRGEVLLEKLI